MSDVRVFITKHSTDWHREIADDNTVLRTQVGSGLHGVTVKEADDRDEMGIAIEPPEVALSCNAKAFEQYEYRSQPVGVRSGPGDLDLVVYSLRKFVRLASAGNPTVLMPLFAPDAEIVRIAEPGLDLRANALMLLSKKAGLRFLGYLNSQRRHLSGESAPRLNRPELIEQYGFDTKYAYHSMRIAIQGIELMESATIELPMRPNIREHLRDVRRGKFTLAECLDEIADLSARLTAATSRSELPEAADDRVVNAWLAQTYRAWWERV